MDHQADAVTLPVYFHWEFRTGTGGDFEALVKLLTARDLRETQKSASGWSTSAIQTST